MFHAYAIVKLLTREIIQYPYTEDDLKSENVGTIYTGDVSLLNIYPHTEKAVLNGYIIVEVYDAGPPGHDMHTHRITEASPILKDGRWIRNWDIIEHTPDELAARLKEAKSNKIQHLHDSANQEILAIKKGYPEQVTDLWFIMLTEALVIRKRGGQIKTALLGEALKPGETNLQLAEKIISKHAEFRKKVSPTIGKLRLLIERVEKSNDIRDVNYLTW